MIVAIHPDNYGKGDASSPLWASLLQQAGVEVRWVDAYSPDILDRLRDCHGFMWRWGHFGGMYRVARRLLPVIERELGILTYPDQNTCWHYDDKIAQAYALHAAGIPIPKTWIWYDRIPAQQWAKSARYPLVIKLSGGAGSSNVRLVRSYRQAKTWIAHMFGQGLYAFPDSSRPWKEKFKDVAKRALNPRRSQLGERHRGYVLFQEFLANNPFDTRVTIIGNRAFGFRRFNRDQDFRASGSGKIDYDPGGVDPAFIHLAFRVAQNLRSQSCGVDGLRRDTEPVVGEISYTYASWAIHACAGHWELADNELKWCEGHMWPEEAQIQDFLGVLSTRYGS